MQGKSTTPPGKIYKSISTKLVFHDALKADLPKWQEEKGYKLRNELNHSLVLDSSEKSVPTSLLFLSSFQMITEPLSSL